MRTVVILSFLFVCLSTDLSAQGKVGINTTTPSAMLHVKDSSVVFTGLSPLPNNSGNPPVSGAGTRMMWYADRAAFRAGTVTGPGATYWNKDNVGLYSVAMGYNTKAKGPYSTAIGDQTEATGTNSTSMGLLTKAFGHGTTAMGINTNARPYASVVLGRYNDTTATSPFAWTLTDPLFIIGNGVSNASRSNALTVLKNGNIGIGIPNPGFLLNFPSTLGDKISLWGSTGAHYGFGIQSNALQIHTDVSASDVVFGYGTSTALTETMRIKGNGNVGIATSTPDFKLDINGRMRIRHGADGSPGIWFNKSDNTSATSFMGVFNDEYVGIYGSQGSAWNFLMSTITGNVGIGLPNPLQKLHVNGGGLFSGSLFAIGSLGIGTTTPITKLHVNDGNSGATPPATSIATFENNGETTINLSAPDANYSGIRFNHPDRTGGIYYNKDDNDFGLTFATGSYPNMVITAPGYVGINNPSPDEMLDVWANGKFGGAVFASCGVLSCSDMRYKRDISPLTNALSHIQRLNGVYYYWDIEKHPDKRFSDQRQIGIIAQELEKVYPELVHTDNDGYKTVDYSRLSPILLQAIKEQQQIIELQNKKLENQQSQIDFLMKELLEMKEKSTSVSR